jgi:hypothetical protein
MIRQLFILCLLATACLPAALEDADDANVATAIALVQNSATLTGTTPETPTLVISGNPGSIREGGAGNFNVRLSSAPGADVTVTISSSDATELAVGTPTLTFTTGDFAVDQNVILNAVDETNFVDVNVTITISTDNADIAATTINVLADDTDKYIYITAATYSGDMAPGATGIAGADAECNSAANLTTAGLTTTGTYKALLVDGTARVACINANCTPTNAGDFVDWVFEANTNYYRANGTTLIQTSGANRLLPFNLLNAMGAGSVWTGLSPSWTTGVTCTAWTTTAGTGAFGDAGSSTITALESASFGCTNTFNLACVQQ